MVITNFAGGFPRFLETPLGKKYLIINIIGAIHTVWAQLVNHTMKPTLDLYYNGKSVYKQ